MGCTCRMNIDGCISDAYNVEIGPQEGYLALLFSTVFQLTVNAAEVDAFNEMT